MTAGLARTLKKLAAEVDAASKKRERQQREYFGRCNCPESCFFHSSYGV